MKIHSYFPFYTSRHWQQKKPNMTEKMGDDSQVNFVVFRLPFLKSTNMALKLQKETILSHTGNIWLA